MLKFKGPLSADRCGARVWRVYCVFSVFWGLAGSPGAAGSRGAARGHRVYEGPKGESKGGSGKRAGGFQAGGVNIPARTMGGGAENRGRLSSFSGLEF